MIGTLLRSGGLAWALVLLVGAGCTRKKEEAPAGSTRRLIEVPPGFDWLNVELNTSNPLIAPTKMTIAPDGRVFVCEQGGKVRVVKNDVLLPTPLLTLPGVNSTSDNGLQAIALDPEFATPGAPGQGRFFVYYHRNAVGAETHPWGRVASYRISAGNADVADATPVAQLDLDEIRSSSGGIPGSHVGGTLAVGNDGMLYLALGYADVSESLQRANTHSATKLLRMRLSDLGPAPGNPFEISGTNAIMKRLWGRGLRNPFSLAVRRTTGRMFFDDVGSNHVITPSVRAPKNAWEETNHVPNPGETPGLTITQPYDFGWPSSEGDGPHLVHVFQNGQANENTGGQDCAKIGGAFYDPVTPTFPAQYLGGYFFADYCSGYIDWLPATQQTPTVDDGNPSTFEVPTNVATRFVNTLEISPTDLEVSPDGALYFLGRSTPERAPGAVGYMGKIFTSGPVPAVSVTSPAQGERFSSGGTNQVDVPLTAVATDGNGGVSSIEIFVNAVSVGSCTVSPPEAAPPPCTLTAAGLARGSHKITARATNALGAQKTSGPTTITVDGPTATITTPALGSTYVAGQSISYSGSGTTFDGSPISTAASFSWNIYLRHGSHSHLARTTSGASGTFTPSPSAETDPNVFYEFVLTVTDADGVSHSVSRRVDPVKPTLTLASSPVAGLTIKLEGAYKSTPFGFESVAGIFRLLEAPRKQTAPTGRRYEFTAWADNGSTDHSRQISTPQTNTTYTANFRDATGSGTGLHGEYFADAALTTKVFERTDGTIDFDWGAGAPSGLPADGFSVRWTGKLQPFFGENQAFYVEADGGVRLWWRGSLLIDSWNESSGERVTAEQSGITGGSQYDIRLEFRDTTGPAKVKLFWAASGVLKEIVPVTQAYPAVVIAPAAPALLVHGGSANATLLAGDAALKARLEQQLGLPTDTVTAANVMATQAAAMGRRVVVVSESVTSSQVNTKLTQVPVAVVTLEPSIMDDLGMTGPTFGTHYGDLTGQTALTIVDPANAGGLSGTVTVVSTASTFVWGVPAATGSVIATLAGNNARAAIFRYEAGSSMVVGKAPARRLGSFVRDTAPSLNANGWALFDAGIRWAANLMQPNAAPVVSAGPDRDAEAGVTVTLNGSVTDDGQPAPSALTVGWTVQSGPGVPVWPQGDQNQANTHVQFPVIGTYVLRFAAGDGALSASDDVTINVSPPRVATPTISPNGGSFSSAQQVTLATSTTDAVIRYTLDGSTPVDSSPRYMAPFTLGTSATVKAKAWRTDWTESGVASATFTIGSKTALFIVGNTTLTTSDTALRNRLQAKGFTVTVADDDAVTATNASGKSLVLISHTVNSASVNTKMTSVAVPIINLENALMDDLGMTGVTAGTHYGTENRTTLSIVATGDPLAAGLTGNSTVTTASHPFCWGVPGASATVIAKTTSTSNRAVIFKYEAGATMITGVAPAKRMGFFSGETAAQSHNANGWALFDAAVAWAVP